MVVPVILPNAALGVVPPNRNAQAQGHIHRKPVGASRQKKTVIGPRRARTPLRRTRRTSRFPRKIIRRGSPCPPSPLESAPSPAPEFWL